MQTAGMVLVCCFLAAKCDYERVVHATARGSLIMIGILTVFNSIILTFCKRKQAGCFKCNIIIVLIMVMVVTCHECWQLPIDQWKKRAMLFLIHLFTLIFFILDTYFIVTGNFGHITKDEYMYA